MAMQYRAVGGNGDTLRLVPAKAAGTSLLVAEEERGARTHRQATAVGAAPGARLREALPLAGVKQRRCREVCSKQVQGSRPLAERGRASKPPRMGSLARLRQPSTTPYPPHHDPPPSCSRTLPIH